MTELFKTTREFRHFLQSHDDYRLYWQIKITDKPYSKYVCVEIQDKDLWKVSLALLDATQERSLLDVGLDVTVIGKEITVRNI